MEEGEAGDWDLDEEDENDASICTADTKVLLTYKSQFIASAARIRGSSASSNKRKQLFKNLYDALTNPESWAHNFPPRSNPKDFIPSVHSRSDSLQKPYLGYTLERLWGMLMQCGAGGDVGIAVGGWKCASVLGGARRGGEAGDCQCLD